MDKDAIKSYDVIKEIGKSIYNTRKPTKGKEVKIKARDAMRRMAKLVAATEGVETAVELFLVRNYYALEDAILDMCGMKTDKPKVGLMVAVGTLIRNASKTMVVDHIVKNKSEDVKEVKRFQVINLNYAKVFSTAEYQLKEKWQRDNRKPAALADEKCLEALGTYLIAEMNQATAKKAAMSRVCAPTKGRAHKVDTANRNARQ